MIRLKKLLQEDIENIETTGSDIETNPDYELLYDGWLERGKTAADYLIKKGFSKIIAAAFIGNFAVESGVRPNVSQNLTKALKLGFGFKPTTPTVASKQSPKYGYGLAQWTENRKTSLISYGASSTTEQLDFLIAELKGSQSTAWAKIKTQKTIADATKAVVTYYERAGKQALSDRISKATSIYNQLK
jgi:hypothetical protein